MQKGVSSLVHLLMISMLFSAMLMNAMLFAGERKESIELSLDAAVDRAIEQNNQLRASKFAMYRASWDKKNAWTMLLPVLNFSSRFTRIDDRTFAERDFRRYLPPELRDQIPQTVFQESYFSALEVTMPLFNGALLNSLMIANASKQMAQQTHQSTRDNIIYLVVSGYLNVLNSSDVLKLQREYLELSRLNYEKAERMEQAGRYSKAEVLRWKVDFQQQKSTVVTSENVLRTARAVLHRLLNARPDEHIEVQHRIPDNLTAESERLAHLSDNELLKLIDITDTELIAANDALAAIKSGTDVEKWVYRNSYASYLPNASVSYSHGWRENNTAALDDYSPKTLLINVSMPLFTSFQNLTSTKAAYYNYKQSEEMFYDQLQNTRFVLTETVNKLLNLKTQRELSKTTIEYSERNYRIVEQQKEKGLVSNIDFIDAKLNLQNAKLNDINTHYDFISAMVELYYMLGKLDHVMD